MAYYRTEKVGKTRRTNIFDAESGEYVCQLYDREVAGWLRGAERARAEAIIWEAEVRASRLAAAKAYLAQRALRPVQLKLF